MQIGRRLDPYMTYELLKRCCQVVLISLFFCTFISSNANAQIIIETLPSGVRVNANFHEGDPAKPAVLLLHGFLTTYNFNTVYGIFNLLADKNYTVVAPNLSLGINQRMSGLHCDAIHIHNMEDDLKEVAWWVDWLTTRGHEKIILIGHSTGSLHLVVYASRSPNKAVKLVIATSLTSFQRGDEHADSVTKSDVQRAKKLQAKGDKSLNQYSISYCRENFVAPADVFLSYAYWSGKKVLQAVQNTKVPLDIILAGKDPRFDKQWSDKLRNAGASVAVVKNASHFFDDEYEFDLHDRISTSIENMDN